MRLKILVILLFVALISTQAQIPDFEQHFAGMDATFVIYDAATDVSLIYNPDRANLRLAPCSTFKIPNAAIGLEAGSVADESEIIQWDSELYPYSDLPDVEPFNQWTRDHDLASGMQYSVIWFFTEVAKRTGQEQMQSWLETIAYGNMDSSAWLEPRQFWLTGALQITANEQINFLRGLYSGEYFSERTTEIVKRIILLEETDAYRFYGKTGSCINDGGRSHGWLVGFVEVSEEVYFYALNFRTTDFFNLSQRERITLVKTIFEDAGILPTS